MSPEIQSSRCGGERGAENCRLAAGCEVTASDLTWGPPEHQKNHPAKELYEESIIRNPKDDPSFSRSGV